MLRYLRITFSVVFAALTLLLAGLWVRSYWRVDFVDVPLPGSTKFIGIALIPGHVWWLIDEGQGTWTLESSTVDQRRKAVAAAMGDAAPDDFAKGFRFESNVGWMPYWFLLLLTAPLSAAPWMRLRFSLRTLLVVTALVAILLGIILPSM